jgi:exonuclease III
MRVATWNLARRMKRTAEHAAVLRETEVQVAVLTEVTFAQAALLLPALARADLVHTVSSLPAAAGASTYGVLIASRDPIVNVEHYTATASPERLLCVRLLRADIEVTGAYVPTGVGDPDRKSDVLEALAQVMERPGARRIVCGDLNAPRSMKPDGSLVTFGQRLARTGLPRPPANERMRRLDAAERRVFQGPHGLRYAAVLRDGLPAAYSWFTKPQARGVGYRFDHFFTSPDLDVSRCEYDVSVIERGLSDHAMVVLDVDNRV